MIFVDQLLDIDAAQHKLLSIDRGKSRFSRQAVVAHIRSLPTPVNFAMTLLARYDNFFTASSPRVLSISSLLPS